MPVIRKAATAGSLAIALATASLLATPAVGATQEAPIEVRTNDLDLASESGQRKLDVRLKIAARRVCGKAADPKELRDVAKCRAQAIAEVADDRESAIAASRRPHNQLASVR